MKTKSILLKAKKLLAVLAVVMVLMSCAAVPAQAGGTDALTIRPLTTGVTEVDTMLNNLNGLITGLVMAVGQRYLHDNRRAHYQGVHHQRPDGRQCMGGNHSPQRCDRQVHHRGG